MIKIEKENVYGFEEAIRGMRNPKNSWDKSDSEYEIDCDYCTPHISIGENDLKLMKTLSGAGDDHGKFMRMITVSMDITAPLYWWKEFDTYKVGTVADSCSTMHKIHAKEFVLDDFSHEHLNIKFLDHTAWEINGRLINSIDVLEITIDALNNYRNLYLEEKNTELKKQYWWQMIQLLPSSYNQKRTIMLNYQVLKHMYHARKEHKLDEWRDFCKWVETLPYSELITNAHNVQE